MLSLQAHGINSIRIYNRQRCYMGQKDRLGYTSWNCYSTQLCKESNQMIVFQKNLAFPQFLVELHLLPSGKLKAQSQSPQKYSNKFLAKWVLSQFHSLPNLFTKAVSVIGLQVSHGNLRNGRQVELILWCIPAIMPDFHWCLNEKKQIHVSAFITSKKIRRRY